MYTLSLPLTLRRNRRAALAMAMFSTLWLLPLAASAARVTVTFDRGGFDETITDPTGEYHGPYAWLEEGIRVDGFWAEDVGTPDGAFGLGHVHTDDNVYQDRARAPYGYGGEATHAYTDDLQGLVISLENGGTFDLVSIDYDVWFLERLDDPLLQRLPWSHAPDDPKIVITESFDPSLPDFESQWTAFGAISDLDFPAEGDWHTLDLTSAGFTGLTSIMISQTAAQTWLDNIVIETSSLSPVPEPSTATLLGLGLLGLGRSRRRPRA